ncbi:MULTISPECIES: flagellar motor switch phosphatase FliY [unclassified Halanaerobium]|uniref:flagellar motor switch phosphatase FliY n=1 Tax=unclassified Halanaerobium TaxID=2641197 RepID=UPI000E13CA78|nr:MULTISPECIES: flagellar motor switch phosphatase FliY [unclassified Halanaerobium]RCW47680.1 flagellar motor switch protein FliN/FliY [Halanaerobium sp. MA284_MarDTE_T2]RCW84676.1 flagellar motor switch protein FliN/FliY [Halanaerobium sp. DL-01]
MMSNDGNFLSQEEIDALMNSQEEEEDGEEILTSEEIDVIGEIGNISMGSSATALSTLLDKKVEITAPEVKVIKFQEVIDEYDRPCVLVRVKYIKGLEGVNLLVINTEDAAIIADLMMGGDGISGVDEDSLNDIYISAVGEAMNQMMGSASTAMSNILDEIVNISPPAAEYIELNDVLKSDEDWFKADEEVVVTSFNLKVGDLIDSTFKQISSLAFVKELADSLLHEGEGLIDKTIDEEKLAEEAKEEVDMSAKRELQNSLGETSSAAESSPTDQQRSAASSRKQTKNRNVKKEETVAVQTAQFPEFDEQISQPLPNNMELIKDVPLEVTVRLGKTSMKIREILELGDGSIIELDKLAGEPVDLLVNGKLVAKGEVVVIDENFGFRVKDIISPAERLTQL